MKILFLCLKLLVAQKLCPHSVLTFCNYIWGNFWQSPLKCPIIAQSCLDMFEGEGLMSILKI